MQQELNWMEKSKNTFLNIKFLSEIDSIYNETICRLPKQSQLEYCEHLIDKTQLNLVRNKTFIGEDLKEQLMEIIKSAQNELQKINSEQ